MISCILIIPNHLHSAVIWHKGWIKFHTRINKLVVCENRNLGCYGWQIKFAEKINLKEFENFRSFCYPLLTRYRSQSISVIWPDTKYKMKCMIKEIILSQKITMLKFVFNTHTRHSHDFTQCGGIFFSCHNIFSYFEFFYSILIS